MLSVIAAQVTPGATGQTIRARIVGAGNVPITQATLTSVTVQVTDLSLEALQAGSGAIATHNPAVSACVYNALVQSDQSWKKDSAIQLGDDDLWGYNFLFTVPAADFSVANSGHAFQADVKCVPALPGSEPFRISVKIPTKRVYV